MAITPSLNDHHKPNLDKPEPNSNKTTKITKNKIFPETEEYLRVLRVLCGEKYFATKNAKFTNKHLRTFFYRLYSCGFLVVIYAATPKSFFLIGISLHKPS